MNPILTKVLIGAGSAVVSGVSTWLVLREVYSRKMEETIAEEVAKFKKDYQNRQFGRTVAKPDISDVAIIVDKAKLDHVSQIATDIILDQGYFPDEDSGESLINEADEDEEDEWPGDPDIPIRIHEDPTLKVEPYIIDLEQFSDSEAGVVQEVLIYYEGDDVLATEHGTVATDIPETVGNDWLQSFGKGSMNANVVYVRNEKLGIDYEIYLNDGTYAEEVHGIKPHRQSHRKMREGD